MIARETASWHVAGERNGGCAWQHRPDRADRRRAGPGRLRGPVGPGAQPPSGGARCSPHRPGPFRSSDPTPPPRTTCPTCRPGGRGTTSEPTVLTPELRESIRREITGAQAVTIRAGYASRDFVTDPESGWAVLDQPAVLVLRRPGGEPPRTAPRAGAVDHDQDAPGRGRPPAGRGGARHLGGQPDPADDESARGDPAPRPTSLTWPPPAARR